MNKHTVYVAGKKFILLSKDKPEYIQELVKDVNKAINKISVNNPSMESRSVAILCALDYADEKNKEIQRCKRLIDNANSVVEQSVKHTKKIKELKKQLAEAKENNEEIKEQEVKINKLLEENKSFESANLVLAEENGSLKEEAEKLRKEIVKLKRQSEKFEIENNKLVDAIKNLEKQQEEASREQTENTSKKKEEKKVVKEDKGYIPVRQISLFEDE